jgi:hypothetical protein
MTNANNPQNLKNQRESGSTVQRFATTTINHEGATTMSHNNTPHPKFLKKGTLKAKPYRFWNTRAARHWRRDQLKKLLSRT